MTAEDTPSDHRHRLALDAGGRHYEAATEDTPSMDEAGADPYVQQMQGRSAKWTAEDTPSMNAEPDPRELLAELYGGTA